VNNSKIYMLSSTGRQVFPFHWESKSLPCPWKDETHMRVLVPLSENEKRNSDKLVHIQIVKRSKIMTLNSGMSGVLKARRMVAA
jgi:diphthamide biosynthesis methyltransferase